MVGSNLLGISSGVDQVMCLGHLSSVVLDKVGTPSHDGSEGRVRMYACT